jgi:hypothetical protein
MAKMKNGDPPECTASADTLKPCPAPTEDDSLQGSDFVVDPDVVAKPQGHTVYDHTEAKAATERLEEGSCDMQWFEIGAHEEKTEAEGDAEAKEARIVVPRTDILAKNQETAKLILIKRIDGKADLERVVLHIRPFGPTAV